MALTKKFTTGVTVWVPRRVRSELEQRATEREVSLGVIVREVLKKGREHMRPYKLHYQVEDDQVQLSFMVSPDTMGYLRRYANQMDASQSAVIRAHLEVGLRK
jgi:hypothetical protein